METIATPRLAEPIRLASNEFVLMHGHELQETMARDAADTLPADADEMDPNDTVDEDDEIQEQFPDVPDGDPADTLDESDIHSDGEEDEDAADTLDERSIHNEEDIGEDIDDFEDDGDPTAETLHDEAIATEFDDEQLPDFLR